MKNSDKAMWWAVVVTSFAYAFDTKLVWSFDLAMTMFALTWFAGLVLFAMISAADKVTK